MDVEFESRKETNKLVILNVTVPRTRMQVKSNTFQLSGCNWYFVFGVDGVSDKDQWGRLSCVDELWHITLCSSNAKETVPCFPLIVYIRHKGKDLYFSQIGINSTSTKIWSCHHSDFTKRYPDIKVVGTHLQFVFDFHLRKLDLDIFFKEENPYQTSHLKAETKYKCLENLSLDLSKLIEDGTDTDVLLKCGDVSIGAHKVILGARCEVFRTMMQTDMVEGREGIVQISDMEPKILKIFVKYIYTGNLPDLTMDTALPIYEAADKYQVEALKKRSGHLLVKNLSRENALAILVAADAHSDTDLKDQLVSYISEEKIPSRKEEWLNFCNEYPKLATEVLNFMFLE